MRSAPARSRAVADTRSIAAGRLQGHDRGNVRPLSSGQRTYGMRATVLWDVVRNAAAAAGFNNLAPHDLRRTVPDCATSPGGELDQIQFLLGHISIQTTERYLGCKHKLRCAVNDRLGIEPDAA